LTAAYHPTPKSAGDLSIHGAAGETSQTRRQPPEASPKTMEELSFGHVQLLEDMAGNWQTTDRGIQNSGRAYPAGNCADVAHTKF